MSAPKHTPGPWSAEAGNSNYRWEVHAPGAPMSARVVARCPGGILGAAHANADLIAAAPEQQAKIDALADALEGLRSRYPGEPDRFCDHAAAPCHRCDAAAAALRAAGRLS